jgi:hypothetical protein
VRLLYEDFVRDPVPFLGAVVGKEQAAAVANLLDRRVSNDYVQHQITGNWVRYLRISADESWRSELATLPKLLAG